MNERKVHRLYLHFQELPASLRVLYTGVLLVLGMGYLFAMIYIYESHAGRDADPMLSANDLRIAYSGSGTDSRLEASLKGPMSVMIPSPKAAEIIAWVREGADEQVYEEQIEPLIQEYCVDCHGPSNPHISDLRGYDNVMELARVDTGMDLFTLVRVSHIHLFGIAFIFFVTGLVFSHAYMRPIWFKCAVMGLPFLAMLADVLSWYLTKVVPGFAWVVLISGGVMGLCFAIMWVVSMYQMWFYKLPPHLARRERGDPRVIA